MQAVTDALRLLANVVMAWTTAQMPNSLERWANRWHIIPVELIGRIASTRLEGINLRGVFRFPIERYAALTPAVTNGGPKQALWAEIDLLTTPLRHASTTKQNMVFNPLLTRIPRRHYWGCVASLIAPKTTPRCRPFLKPKTKRPPWGGLFNNRSA